MVRKQIYITKEQEAYLKSQSMKESELIRRALDEYIEKDAIKSANKIKATYENS